MPLYTIVRDVTGLSDGEIDAAAIRAVICAFEYPGFRWIRSYLDRDKQELLCLYEAQDIAQIREHAERSRIPAGEIREVEQLLPDPYIEAASSATPAT